MRVPIEQRVDVEKHPLISPPHTPFIGLVQELMVTPLGRAFLKAFHSARVRVGTSIATHWVEVIFRHPSGVSTSLDAHPVGVVHPLS